MIGCVCGGLLEYALVALVLAILSSLPIVGPRLRRALARIRTDQDECHSSSHRTDQDECASGMHR